MARHALSHNERHKTCNGLYLGMVVPIYSIVGKCIMYDSYSFAALQLALSTGSNLNGKINIISVHYTYVYLPTTLL